jgi:hypothetical protein
MRRPFTASNRLLFAPLFAPGGEGPGLIYRIVQYLAAYLSSGYLLRR